MEYRQLNEQTSVDSTTHDDTIGNSGTIQQRFVRSLSSIFRPTSPLQAERLRWLKIGGIVLVIVLILSIVIAASVNRHKSKAHPVTSTINVTIEGKSSLTVGQSSRLSCTAVGGKEPYKISLTKRVTHTSGKREHSSAPEEGAISVVARMGYKDITLVCEVVDSEGNKARAEKVIEVTASAASLEVTIQGTSSLSDGQSSNLSCSATGGIAPYEITLHEVDKEEVKGDNITVTADKMHKKIVLICSAKDSVGASQRTTKTITILVGPDPSLVRLRHMGNNGTVKSGSVQEYECNTGGATPAPTIAWKIIDQVGGEQEVNETSNTKSEMGGYSKIRVVMKDGWTSINIFCVVSNNVSAVNKSIIVNIVPKDVPQKETFFGINRTFMLVVTTLGPNSNISKIDLDSPNHSLINVNATSTKHAYDLEFDYEDQCLFWANNKPGQIVTKCFKNKSQEFSNEMVILSDPSLGTIEAMAYDQTSKILYFVDAQNASIEMIKISANTSGTVCHQQMRTKVLQISLAGSKSKPRGLALHPAKGYLFYSDTKRSLRQKLYGYIGRSELDGQNHVVIVNRDRRNKTFVNSPSHLTVDVVTDRLFWVDFYNKQISNSNLDGGDLKEIKPSDVQLPFSIGLLAKNIYWSDKSFSSIFVVGRDNITSSKFVSTGNGKIFGLKIYSPLSLSPTTACSNNPCSHLCIARPASSAKPYSCICPQQMLQRGEDGPCVCPEEKWEQGHCDYHEFECTNSTQCINRGWRCNGQQDCYNGADEFSCKDTPVDYYDEYYGEDEVMDGRPFIVEGKSRTTHSETRNLPEMNEIKKSPSVAPRNPHIRDIGRHWLRHAEAEHASIASFARHTLQLMSLGAPSHLLAASQQASLDEVKHAEICYGFASAFLGSDLGPGPLDVEGSLQSVDVEQIVHSLIVEGCIGETLSAMEVHLAAQYATDKAVKEALEEIADDETKHSQLAWDTLVWIMEKFPDTEGFVLDTFKAELEESLVPARNESSLEASVLCRESAKDSAFHKYGLLVKADRDKVQQVGIRDIIEPVYSSGFENVKMISKLIMELDVGVLTHEWESSRAGYCRG